MIFDARFATTLCAVMPHAASFAIAASALLLPVVVFMLLGRVNGRFSFLVSERCFTLRARDDIDYHVTTSLGNFSSQKAPDFCSALISGLMMENHGYAEIYYREKRYFMKII